MSNIDPDMQKYFDNYIDLFATPGWAQFKQEIQASLEDSQRTAVQRCDTAEKWFEERGMQVKLMRILSFDNALTSQYEEMKRDSEDEEDPVLYEDDPELYRE